MPRFGTKSLLIGVALAAIWLSTFAEYDAAPDVRAAILLIILFAGITAAIYSRGRRQAFWICFVGVLLIMYLEPKVSHLPHFGWARKYAEQRARQMPVDPPGAPPTALPPGMLSINQSRHYDSIYMTIRTGCLLTLATLIGTFGANVYDFCRRTEQPHSKP